MTNMKKKAFGIVMSSLMILSTLVLSAGASNYDKNTHYRNLYYSYDTLASPTGMNIYYRYNPNNARAHTSVHVRPQNTRGKAYVALMQYDPETGKNLGFKEEFCEDIKDNGHIDTTVYGSTQIAKYVLHSGYSLGTNNWRYDVKHKHGV